MIGGSSVQLAIEDMTVKSSDIERGTRVARDSNQIIIPRDLFLEVGIREGESARTSPAVAAIVSLHQSRRHVTVQNIVQWLGIKEPHPSYLLENKLISVQQ